MSQKITPFLWFNKNGGEAMKFYVSVFKNSKITQISEYDGKVFGGAFRIAGQEFMVLNGGPQFKFNEAISLYVSCKTQKEVDYYWRRLTAGGGKESRCGWLKDKFGVSWQIVPEVLGELLGDSNPEKSGRAFAAMMKMKKLDIARLKAAHRGK